MEVTIKGHDYETSKHAYLQGGYNRNTTAT